MLSVFYTFIRSYPVNTYSTPCKQLTLYFVTDCIDNSVLFKLTILQILMFVCTFNKKNDTLLIHRPPHF